ncbi:hypothetical protein [Acetobacterium bakii]|uniref:hypothetical protein n=1 Tax=Acetobacterium bakii TaxID=52689 RepID=UPI0013648B5D|nr:hypothetical protein [Acetobacterium bakii]
MNVQEASSLYTEKFGQEFPFYDLIGEDDTQLILIMLDSIEKNEPFVPEYDVID